MLGMGSGVELSVGRCKEEEKMNNRITTDQVAELLAQDKAGRITRENFQAFLRNPNGHASGKPTQYSVIIDYAKSVEQMKSDGQYDWSNDNINGENFPITGEEVVETKLELVHLNKVASTKEVEAYLEENGFRPATLEELLAFGATFPDVQREYPVVALGSSWVHRYGFRDVPYLHRRGSERNLNLSWGDSLWFGICRFLAVRK
jgi:hypothetical protein